MQPTPPAKTRSLTFRDFRTLGLAALGGALEFYDFIIFVFFATVIGKLFFPPDMPGWLALVETFGIFAAGYLVRPLGGILLAHFGDRFGRKRVFMFSVLLMAVATLGMAALPTYGTIGVMAPVLLVVTRLLQGMAVGGEVPGAWTFVAEHVPGRHVGFACGFLCSGLTLGILLGSLIATLINVGFTPGQIEAYAWRIPFALGGVFGFAAVYLRQWLEETPVFVGMRQHRTLARELPLKVVLREHRRGVVISMLLTWVLAASIVVTTLMTATLLQKLYGYDARMALAATSFGMVFLIIGTAAAGAIVDRVGSGKFFIGASGLFAAATWVFYTYAAVSPAVLFTLYAVMGLAVGLVGSVPYVMVRLFPAPVRFTGVSFAYNTAYAIAGGLTPLLVATLMPTHPMAHAYYLLGIAALALGLGIYLAARGNRIETEAGLEEVADSALME